MLGSHDGSPDPVDVESDLARAHVHERLFGTPQQRLRLGRYEPRRVVGRGGAGVVFEASDPALGRKVALKVLWAGGDGTAGDSARVRREAQALARLDHPNIVRVFDAGSVESFGAAAKRVVYIAMELIDGASLHQVAGGRPVRWSLARRWILAMGRGLAAAHAAGIVHRDFKPQNVLLERDARGTYDEARVLVADFGLARPLGESSLEASAARWSGSGSATVSGKLAGTPGYIAPELLQGAMPDARSDQFAFFVAVYELLYGMRPFATDSISAWRDAVQRGVPDRSFAAQPVPRHIVAALARGLAADPRRRFVSMDAALAALDARPHSRLLGVAAAASVAGLAAVSWGGRESAAPCERAAQALEGVLNDERRAAIDRSTGTSEVSSTLDRWAHDWSSARRRACEDATDLGDRALRCLDARRGAFEAAVDRLAEGSESTLGARGLLATIPSTAPCADPQQLAAAVPIPEEPARAAEAAEIRRMLAGISLRDRLGEYDRASQLSQSALARAEALGDPYVLVETKVEVGAAMRSMGERGRAEPLIAEAIETAEQIRHDEVVVQAIATMILIVAGDPTRLGEVPRLAARGEAALVRVGSPPRLVAMLATSLYWVDATRGDADGAIAHAERGLAALALVTEPSDAMPFSALEEVVATQRHEVGDSQRALRDLGTLLERKRAVLGDDNLEVAYTLKLLAQIQAEVGQREESIANAERALEIASGLLGHEHPALTEYHNTAATSYGAAMRGAETRFHLDRAIAVASAAAQPDRTFLCAAMLNRITLALMEQDSDEAVRRSDETLDMCRRAYGERHEIYASALTTAGDAAASSERWDEAARRYGDALELLPAGAMERSEPLIGMALVREQLGDQARAIALLEEALSVLDGLQTAPTTVAAARFELGRLLWAANRDRARADSLVGAAREYFASLGEPGRDSVGEIDRWRTEVAMHRTQ